MQQMTATYGSNRTVAGSRLVFGHFENVQGIAWTRPIPATKASDARPARRGDPPL